MAAALAAHGLGLMLDIVPEPHGHRGRPATPGGSTCSRTAPVRRAPRSSTSTGIRSSASWPTRCCSRSWATSTAACWRRRQLVVELSEGAFFVRHGAVRLAAGPDTYPQILGHRLDALAERLGAGARRLAAAEHPHRARHLPGRARDAIRRDRRAPAREGNRQAAARRARRRSRRGRSASRRTQSPRSNGDVGQRRAASTRSTRCSMPNRTASPTGASPATRSTTAASST